jgi:hypothetical protein
MGKPISLVDLDDTLFQTQVKIRHHYDGPLYIAAFDRNGRPRSFMTQEQYFLTDWLLSSTHCIPVTARSTAELERVNIRFRSWKVAAHGSVVITPLGETDSVWQDQMVAALAQYAARLRAMHHFLAGLLPDRHQASARLCTEYHDVPVYLAIKFRDIPPAHYVDGLVDKVQAEFGDEGFHVHRNDNNLHWLPCCIDKGLAVEYLLEILRKEYGPIPVVGFADSVNDYGFLRHCTWWGFPGHSQLGRRVQKAIE